jgi:hypothetical protein
MSFDFFKNLKITEEPKPTRRVTKTPEGLTLRVYPSGKVYPSKQLVELLNLEYGATPEDGNGLDFFEANAWGAYKKLGGPNTILVAAVSRKNAKIDLFATRRTDVSVLEQGPICKELWDLAVKLNPTWKDAEVIDLTVMTSYPITSEDGIYHIPKAITRGERKGEVKVERRENITLYPLSVLVTEEASKEADVVQDEAELVQNPNN